MNAQTEQRLQPLARQLARDYSEGRFNKEGYRARRRELVVECTGESPAPRPLLPEESTASHLEGMATSHGNRQAPPQPAPETTTGSPVSLMLALGGAMLAILLVLSAF